MTAGVANIAGQTWTPEPNGAWTSRRRLHEVLVPERQSDGRTPVLYLAPWIDLGGSDKGTIDWFKHIDRSRWAPSIITTQPSANRWLSAVDDFAEEVWSLPELMPGHAFPSFILGFIESRGIELVHIMNSRLAFDAMPDMTCLSKPPAIVVQLHAEEPDRSGYVRYVSTRYGNLVDAFSVTSRQLADAMLDYHVPPSKLHVITTGVDGREEFDPAHVEPLLGLEGEGVQILWPGRLVAQKDPLLTLEVVKLLDDRGLSFTLQVVGDGDMAPEVHARARALGVEHRICWHPPSHEMPRWYRSCDLLLMTSVFEGVPYVMYEAQAMGMPIVVPALPGNVEFMHGAAGGGALIDPRDDAIAYADALQALIEDDERRAEEGRLARERMLHDFTLEEMGCEHDQLYERLLARRPVTSRAPEAEAAARETPVPPEPVSFPRSPPPERSVAVIVPCYQHGRYLPQAIASLCEQTLPPQRIVIVDDGSPDAETHAALAALEREPDTMVLRQERNMGPSAARNRALAEVTESYVLPLDADDLLLPRSLEQMVEQLEAAPDDVGFIYPNPLHFGNRNDYYEAPAYNLHLLLNDNYCPAASLFDRRAFDAGIRYPEQVVHGHEDWDLVLQMAARSIHGAPAEGPTLLYRKQGFSRLNAVEYGPESFREHVEKRHPLLYGARDRIKGRWAPALSIVLVDGCDGRSEPWPEDLLDAMARQRSRDFELIRAAPLPGDAADVCVTDVEGAGLELLDAAIGAARGRWVLLAGVGAADMLRRPMLTEQVTQMFWTDKRLERMAFARLADRLGAPFAPMDAGAVASAAPCAVAWQRDPEGASEVVEVRALESALDDVVVAWELVDGVPWRAV